MNELLLPLATTALTLAVAEFVGLELLPNIFSFTCTHGLVIDDHHDCIECIADIEEAYEEMRYDAEIEAEFAAMHCGF